MTTYDTSDAEQAMLDEHIAALRRIMESLEAQSEDAENAEFLLEGE